MKKLKILAMCAMVCMLAVSCGKKEEAAEPVHSAAPYTPKHGSVLVNLTEVKTYNYYNAPMAAAATSVQVDYDQKVLYRPIEIKYSYDNGDTYTYTIPDEFGLWKNEAGRLRVVSDAEGTVWLQGQTKAGKFCEFVFYGNPKYNGKKIKPNSYNKEIKYCK